jgi:WD40 repeat protein
LQSGHLTLLGGKGSDPFSAPGHFVFWSLDPWQHVATVDDPRSGIFASSLDREARSFAVGHIDGSITLHDLVAGTSRDVAGRHNGAVQGVSFSADGTTLGSGGDDGVAFVWRVASGELVASLEAHNGKIFAPAFGPDGRTVHTAGLDGAAILWDLEGSRRLGRPFRAGSGNGTSEESARAAREPTSHVALSPDGRRAAVPQDTAGIAVVDLHSGKQLFVTPRPSGKVLDVAWSPGGEEIATGAVGGELEIWSADDGSRVQRSFHGTPSKFPPGPDVPPDATNDVHTIAYSPDGAQLAAALSDGRILRWDARTGTPIGASLGGEKSPARPALDLAYSPDGDKLAAAIVNIEGEGGVAIVWSLPEGDELYRANIDDGYGRGSAVAFTPDGRLLATGGGSGEIKFWDATTGARAGTSLTGTAGWVTSLEFDPTGELLVSGSTDGFTRLWDVPRRAPFGTPLPGLENIDLTARLTADGKRVVAVYSVGQGFDWQLEPAAWKRHACAVAGRTLTESEWELYLPGEEYAPACLDQKP